VSCSPAAKREAAPAMLAAGGIFMHGGGVAATPRPQEVAAGVQLGSGKLPASTSAPVTTSSGGTTRRSFAPMAAAALCRGQRGAQARKAARAGGSRWRRFIGAELLVLRTEAKACKRRTPAEFGRRPTPAGPRWAPRGLAQGHDG
jgi:hypothetical protein